MHICRTTQAQYPRPRSNGSHVDDSPIAPVGAATQTYMISLPISESQADAIGMPRIYFERAVRMLGFMTDAVPTPRSQSDPDTARGANTDPCFIYSGPYESAGDDTGSVTSEGEGARSVAPSADTPSEAVHRRAIRERL